MSVSGKEEIGINPLVLRLSSCDYPVGIPIKKRKYPMIRASSPPPDEELSSSPVESTSLHKDQSSPSQGSTLLCPSVDSSSCIEANKCTEIEVGRESSCVAQDRAFESSTNFHEVDNKEAALDNKEAAIVRMSSSDKISETEKSVEATNPASQIVSENIDMDHIHDTESVKVKVEAKTSELKLQGKTQTLLPAKENFHPDLSIVNGKRINQIQDASEPISLSLTLSKENIFRNQSKTNVADVQNPGSSSRLSSDRANWDLNAPMDSWVGPSGDIALGQTSFGRIGASDRAHAVKPLLAQVSFTPDICKITERKNLTSLVNLSNLTGRQSEDSLHLRLSPCLQLKCSEQSTPTVKLSSFKAVPTAKLPSGVGPSSNLDKVRIGPVKAEPVEESLKLKARESEASIVVSMDSGIVVKRELVDPSSLERCLALKSVDPRPVKPEPVSEGNKQSNNTKQANSIHPNEYFVRGSDRQSAAATSQSVSSIGNFSLLTEYEHSHASLVLKTSEMSSSAGSSLSTENELRSVAAKCKTTGTACANVNSSALVKLARAENLSKNSGQLNITNRSFSEVQDRALGSNGQVASDMGVVLTSVDGKFYKAKADDSTTDSPEKHESKMPNSLYVPSHRNVVGSASGKEKINTSAEIEGPCGSDYESDGNRDIDLSVDMEIDSGDDYEDGEVRESLEQIAAKESVCEKEPSENGTNNVLNTETLEVARDSYLSLSYVEVRGVKTCTSETGKDSNETSSADCGDRIQYRQESIVETPLGADLTNGITKTVLQSPLDLSGNRGAEELQERDSVQAVDGGIDTLPFFSYGRGSSVNGDHLVPKNDPALPKSLIDANNVAKDIDNGNRSRIINLPRSSGSSSPCRTRTFAGRTLPARTERERIPDLAHDGDKRHSRGREDMYFEGTPKYARERHHDQTPRNSRFNFSRGRGRSYNRPGNFNGNRESDREYASEYYNCTTEYRVPRHKFSSLVSDPDLEYNSYNAGEDSSRFGSSGRGAKKSLNDGGSYVRRMPMRRSPPGGVVRRVSRNFSPNRCVVEDGSEMVRPRRNVRGFADDNLEPMFTHPPPHSYESVDGGHFMQGNRNYHSAQRRVMHRIRSKSPVGSSRTRSPGVWSSSPRRRSPDGFARVSDLSHQRSPPFYRMKSPDRRCFPGEVVVRRQQDMSSNRSPSSRIVIRDRRFDPQERPEVDDFYGGERRGPVRPYRASFNNSGDSESFHLNSEDGSSRPLRFCPDENTEFQERNNLAERDFNRRLKNRNLNAPPPRRMRNIEDQDVNYRHGGNNSSNGQVWQNNNEFDETSRVKRKRY